MVVLAIVLAFARSFEAGDPLPVYGEVPAFSLTNEAGKTVTRDSLLGRVWICDVIFTRCPSQCLRMSELMSRLQKQLADYAAVRIVSLTADPSFDTPPVLKAYAARFGADPQRWMFLTGDKPALHHLAADGLKFVVADKKPGERDSADDLFIHTTKAVLVDKQGRIRKWFSTEEENSARDIVRAAKALAKEPGNAP
jgi:cytochrome oxidase Cu insertion factor (SCO1/SenC/PrrC family)